MAKTKCVITGEDAVCRGLSARCYQAASQAVKDGKVTWEELEAKGLALPPKRRNLGPNPFIVALVAAEEGEAVSKADQAPSAEQNGLPWQGDE